MDDELSSKPAQPLVLFPVRLETRFFPQPDGRSELCVRVYPDKIHIDSHEPELTPEELTWGQHFWEQMWRAGADHERRDENRRKAAWQQLADRFDPPRAAWVVRSLTPLNREDQPADPIDPDQPLLKSPRFPTPPLKDDAWTRAPLTRVLPNAWTLLGYKNGIDVVRRVGKPIPEILPTGPNPLAPETGVPADQLAIDEGMKWLVDFDEAERIGMGIRVMLTKAVAAGGMDFLVVVGIKTKFDPTEDYTPLLAELFDAHHYTYGLSFLRPGTPSNNTQDAPSGFSSNDPGHESSYAAEFNEPDPKLKIPEDSNADRLTRAFGLPRASKVFANIPNAGAQEQGDARHMNTALWQASWGYFLLQMLGVGRPGESPLTDQDIDWARDHFINYVRANGPLPTLRVGKQPYGVLPVTSLNRWKPPAGQEGRNARDLALRDFLLNMRDMWRRNFQHVPRLGRNELAVPGGGPIPDVDRDMAEVLSMEGLSSSYSIRHLMGRHYTQNLWSFLGADLDAHKWWAKQEELTSAALRAVGAKWRPRLAHAMYSPLPVVLSGALVQAEQTGNELKPNYIESLLASRDFTEISLHMLQPQPPTTLLYLLLRHSMLLEYVAAGTRLLVKRGLLQPEQRREQELVNFPGLQTLRLVEPLATKISVQGELEQIPLGRYLLGFTPTGEPDVAREPDLQPLGNFRASLTYLKSLKPDRLEQLMTSTLDLCSHRLDAWITSFATKRLTTMRQKKPTGLLVGGYGWVMNLKANPASAQTRVVPVPADEQDPVYQALKNPGFVHAPSLTQASTVAVLRSGHLTHAGAAGPLENNPLDIDLTSERVRMAQWLLDGVRQGQPLGALLGYRFERRLQEADKSQFISHFREIAPLVAGKLEQTKQAVENIAANNVVDGLALSRRWQATPKPPPPGAGRLVALFKQAAPQAVLAERAFLEAELNALADSVDAVADALLAESVYQVVRGNPLRAASTVESVAGGETPPPELEVMRTPRTGVALTHRLVALFSGEPALPPQWTTPKHPQRAEAEPHLNAWAAKLLGDPANVRCLVEQLESETAKVLDTKELRLDQLLMSPLDFVYALEGGQGGRAEIAQRIIYAVTRSPDGFPPGSRLRVNPDRKPDWKATELSYGEFAELLRTTRKLLTGVRGIDAGDLNLPERSTAFGVDVDELEGRVTLAEQSLGATSLDFERRLAEPENADLDLLRELMLRSAAFGVIGAIPLPAAPNSPADRMTLLAQADSIRKEIAQRVEQLTALAGASASTDEARRDRALARLRVVFGKSFVVLPRFTAANADELVLALDNSTQVQDGDPMNAVTWFLRMARVRDGVARLDAALSGAEAVNAGEKLKLSVAQLPLPLPQNAEKERWVGLPLKDGQSLAGGKLSLVVQSGSPLDLRQPLAGVLFDEWVEVVPSATETTGISFQYDQPNAAPPQTILIAVPPDVDAPWTLRLLQEVLLETLDLARVRAVDPDALGEVGHYLPALYFAHNSNPFHTVSTDLAKLK